MLRQWHCISEAVQEWFLDDTLSSDDTLNDTVNGTVNNLQTPIVLTVRQRKIVEMIEENDSV